MRPNSPQTATTSSSIQALTELLTQAAVAPIEDQGWLRVTGSDRVRWLNGMVTNSIQSLTEGEGCYNFVLNAQGRIQGDVTAFALPDSLLLETDRARVPGLMTLLDRFIIMDDVELQNLADDPAFDRHGLLVAGPHAHALLASIGIFAQPPSALHLQRMIWDGKAVDLVCGYSPLVPRFELWSEAATIASLLNKLTETGGAQASEASVEALRMLEGRPVYGVDIRDRELPQETAQTRALHFAKGCYLGQEIVERIRSRGNVHRTFSGFVLTGELPTPGTSLTEQDAPAKPVGELTSMSRIALPTGPVQLALGYVRREVLDRGVPLHFEGGTAVPVTLPFQLTRLETQPA